jgi:dTDP-4-dehydrorhamnose reductase
MLTNELRLCVVGGKGMLGTDLSERILALNGEPIVRDLPELDICRLESVREAMPACDAVINCAAFTRVDDAEKERSACYAVNATGAGHVAKVCAERGFYMIQISTDYVFDGKKGSAYVETDPVAPPNYYGETKLAGEIAVRKAGGQTLIVRTQSLYGLRGRNFIKAILNQIRQGKDTLRVVSDQVSSPTYTRHLADALVRLVQTRRTGVVNVAARGQCSWFEFAQAIVARVKPGVQVVPMSAAELKFPATRPAFSVLDTSRYAQWTGHAMPTWEEGLDAYLQEEPLARL